MRLRLTFFIFLAISNLISAQVGGENVYQFLNLSASARQISLGGEVLTLLDDINQPIWNPAVINASLDRKLSVNYSNYLAGVNIGSVTYASKISEKIGIIHANIKYLDYGTLIGADKNGVETGGFSANDIALSIGYAYNFHKTNFYIGSNLKFINSNISNFSSTGVAADFSLLYHSPYKPYTFTIVARNMGTQINSFNGTKEKLPFKIAFGGAYQLEYVPLKWFITLDDIQKWDISVLNPSNQIIDLNGNISNKKINFLENALRHFVVGAELFSKKLINVRFGYNFRRAAELKLQNVRTFSGISFGFGIRMKKFKFNYAYSKFHTASNTSTFSLEIDLDRTID